MSRVSPVRSRWIAPLAALLLAAGVLGGCGADDEDAASDDRDVATNTTTTATTATVPPPTIQDAQAAVDEDDYRRALAIAAALTATEANNIRRRISNRIARRVRFALDRGDLRAGAAAGQAGRALSEDDAGPAGPRRVPVREGAGRRTSAAAAACRSSAPATACGRACRCA